MALDVPPAQIRPGSRAAWMQALPTVATFVLLVLAVGCLYWARPVLIPTALAVLLAFLLSPLVTWLQRRGLPRGVAVTAVVITAGLLLGGLGWLVGSQVMQLASDLPAYEENVAKRIEELRETGGNSVFGNVQRFIHGITAALARPSAVTATTAEASVPVTVVEREAGFTWWLQGLGPVAEPVATTGLVIVLLIYLLLSREDLRDRMLALVGRGRMTVTTKALDDAGRRISRYLLAQFCLNLAFGFVIGIGLYFMGVPHAALWGFLAGLLRYIPYIGPWLAASFPLTMSLLLSAGWLLPLGVIGLFVISELLSNLVIEPWIYGQSIGVSQAALIVAIAVWTWLWGPMGLVLAAPLTVCLVVLGKYVPALKFFDVLLGDEPVLSPDTTFYQRLLARDDDEATEIVAEQAKTLTPVEICDRILIPTLVAASADRLAGQITEEEDEFVRRSVQEMVEEDEIPFAEAASRTTQTPAESAAPGGPPLVVMACATRNGSEMIALGLLKELLDPRRFQLDILSSTSLVSEIIEEVRARQPAALLMAALPPGGQGPTRHLAKRLQQHHPELKILVGRWGGHSDGDERQEATPQASYSAATLAETIRQLDELSQYLQTPSSTATSDPADSAPQTTPHTRRAKVAAI